MAISSTQLVSSPGSIYTSSGNTVISAAYFCNTSASPATFNLFLVANGDSPTDINLIYNSIQLAGNDTYVMDWEKLVLANGDAIYANSAGNISATVSYIGI